MAKSDQAARDYSREGGHRQWPIPKRVTDIELIGATDINCAVGEMQDL